MSSYGNFVVAGGSGGAIIVSRNGGKSYKKTQILANWIICLLLIVVQFYYLLDPSNYLYLLFSLLFPISPFFIPFPFLLISTSTLSITGSIWKSVNVALLQQSAIQFHAATVLTEAVAYLSAINGVIVKTGMSCVVIKIFRLLTRRFPNFSTIFIKILCC